MGTGKIMRDGRYDNTVERMRHGRLRFYTWAGEEFLTWLYLQSEYYLRVCRGIESAPDWHNDPAMLAAHMNAAGKASLTMELACKLPGLFRATDWLVAARACGFKPDPDDTSPEEQPDGTGGASG